MELCLLEEIHQTYFSDTIPSLPKMAGGQSKEIQQYLEEVLHISNEIIGVDLIINSIIQTRMNGSSIRQNAQIYSSVFNYSPSPVYVRDLTTIEYPIHPISIHIMYIYLKLQYELEDSRLDDLLDTIYIGITKSMVDWFSNPKSFSGRITFWELAVFSTIQILSQILGVPAEDLNREPPMNFLTLAPETFQKISSKLQ